jgi:phosphoribosylanthranilate isomerase
MRRKPASPSVSLSPPTNEPEAQGLVLPVSDAFGPFAAGWNIIQCHGHKRELSDCFPYHLIAAFPVRDAASLQAIELYLDACRASRRIPSSLLLDGHAHDEHGGTGQTAPWHLLASFQPGVPIILAGGLTPDNLAEAIRIVRPYGVDEARGVESRPGRKDSEKMPRFLANAREAASPLRRTRLE